MGLTQNLQPTPRTTRRSFDALEGGAVGLGIVAAMGTVRSEPIAILSRETSASKLVEMESFTCVVSHVGEASLRKSVYLEGEAAFGGQRGEQVVVFFQSPVRVVEAPPLLPTVGFLSHCSLCGKSLHGIDIFMYRGERAFCSAECRFQHMLGDEHHEKHCSSELIKPAVHIATSVAAA